MRNISFFLTEHQFLNDSKDITRRLGWINLQPGDRLMACRKCQGIRPGESIVRLGPIEILDARREPLNRMIEDADYGRIEAIREGFPELTGEAFVQLFCLHMKSDPADIITRIHFRKI